MSATHTEGSPAGTPRTPRRIAIVAVLALLVSAGVLPAEVENCLSCHRYRGLARPDPKTGLVQLYHVNPNYYESALGPHSRLRCTDCHEPREVGIVPHQNVSPVDCARTCHLTSPNRAEVRFSHAGIAAMLPWSAHRPAVLDRCNELLGEPLRPGQSRCLLCHGEPTFRHGAQGSLELVAPIDRCDACHADQLPLDTTYAFWHVQARTRSARNPRHLTASCARCHSHTRIHEEFRLPDSVGSYLASFHGKAMQLGSRTTAVCLDCHVGPMQNVHGMLKHGDPGAPTHPERLGYTCRSPGCHPTAGVRITSAGVHLELARGEGAEYLIGVLFLLLIVSTFGPSALLQILELLQLVVGRRDPRHRRRRELAQQLLATPRGRAALCRFTPHQRIQHWILAASFTLLVLTGFPIKFADRPWAEWLVQAMGGLSVVRSLHRYAGIVLLVGAAGHLIYVTIFAWRRKRATGQTWWRTIMALPMVMNAGDLRQLYHLVKYLLFLEDKRPDAERFSLEEKFEYFGVFWGTVLLGVTGVLMWGNAWFTQYIPGRLLTVAVVVHTFEAFLALLHVGVIHLIGVIFSPAVLPMSPAMFTGITPPDEMADAHAGMLERVARELGVTPTGGPSHE